MQIVDYHGWANSVRLANDDVELIVTQDVGPRIVRFAFIDGPNLFGEMSDQQGGSGEDEWMLRGGHRLWIAPEEKPKTYELDNTPVDVEEIPGGVRTCQPAGPLTNVVKTMEITLAACANEARIVHRLSNAGNSVVRLAPWALTVMAAEGMAVIPLPPKIPHTDRLTHNQEWSLWGYTDLGDPRWTIGRRFLLFRQDPALGPNKLGMAQREGWAGYLLGSQLFIKRFKRCDGSPYPDGGVNFETFANEDFLEVETLGPLTDLAPGDSVTHEEHWALYGDIPACESEDDIAAHVAPLVSA